MRTVVFMPRGPGEDQDSYMRRVLTQISDASYEDALLIADGFSVTNFTESRSLNASTATVTQLANFVATFITDLKKRGSKRTQ